MFMWLKNIRHDRILAQSDITDREWQEAFQQLPLLWRLNEAEQSKLKRLVILFLHYKSLEGIGDFEVTPHVRLMIGLQACLLILNLGLDWYDGWVSVVIYPGAYSRQSSETDEYGIVHQGQAHLSGESWQRGPVILSWEDVSHHDIPRGRNVVIHEFAHKLDMLNGRANGLPPLHANMSVPRWAEVFNRAYHDFDRRLEHNSPIPIDHYAIKSPAEFFAVFSEIFFERPQTIKDYYPNVFDQLVAFYRQNPLLTL